MVENTENQRWRKILKIKDGGKYWKLKMVENTEMKIKDGGKWWKLKMVENTEN